MARQGVACVIHYQLPASADMYVHRCGRTARAGNAGMAVALVTPGEAARFAALMQVSLAAELGLYRGHKPFNRDALKACLSAALLCMLKPCSARHLQALSGILRA